jgi:hypothetical protein
MAVAWAELVLHPLTFAMVNPFAGSINKLIIGSNVGSVVGGMPVVRKPLELYPFFEHVSFAVENVYMAHP